MVLWSAVPLVWDMGRIRPSSSDILYNTVRHNLPRIVNQTSQFLLPFRTYGIFPEATVFSGLPVPPVVFSTFHVVCDFCNTSALCGLNRVAVMQPCWRQNTEPCNTSVGWDNDSVGCGSVSLPRTTLFHLALAEEVCCHPIWVLESIFQGDLELQQDKTWATSEIS